MAQAKDVTLSAIVAAVRATVSRSKALADAIRARWSDQSKVTGPDYRAVTDAAKAAYAKAGGSEGGFRVIWARGMADAGLVPVKADGTPVERKGKTGAKVVKTAAKAAAPAKAPISKAQAAAVLFGHSDPELLAAIAVAASHEMLFIEWAQSQARDNAKPRVQRVKKDGTVVAQAA